MLNSLKKLTRKRKCVGRGGDHGGTSCRGNKGQKSRSGGKIPAQFEGGQTPLSRRLPKRGFNNKRFSVRYEVINIGDIQARFEKDALVTKEELVRVGLLKNMNKPVKILGNNITSNPVIVHANACSSTALSGLEAIGGKIVLSA